ncbi:CAP domain-containing protein [Clostridium ganghwense]|uniref:CAP domain-containing protein n=1 Tax=Clostridium ganghwense TaxID=312089 RepID=A0ABT4CT92_9CLOT|nr:CAP domain-containing protein [Clostridium ganghwense]MCY6372293.1 CAP domain-containing protein [Clostridium ganghwense]
MKKKNSIKVLLITVFMLLSMSMSVLAKEITYKTFDYMVKPGDSLWKICVKHEIGISEVLSVNPQIVDPALIYPNHVIKIPDLSEVKRLENEVIRLVNVERSKKGLKPLKANWQLSRVARYKSQDMINKNYFSHTSPVYGSPFDMIRNFGINYRKAGENIAYGQRIPNEVMTSWMNSAGHRQNILSANYAEIGVGISKNSKGQLYWTQMFIGW